MEAQLGPNHKKGDPMRSVFAAAAIVSFLAVPAFAADETPAPATVPAAAAPAAAAPDGATALCKDGTYTMSHIYAGVCSSHRGVAKWLKRI